MAGPFWGAVRRLDAAALQHGLKGHLNHLLLLYQSLVLPTALYGAPVWSTPLLDKQLEFPSHIQRTHVTHLRHLIGARSATPAWNVIHELGRKPLQYYWLKQTITFWNSCLDAAQTNKQLKAVLLSESLLFQDAPGQRGYRGGWMTDVASAITSLTPSTSATTNPRSLITNLRSRLSLHFENDILPHLITTYHSQWTQFGPNPDYRATIAGHRRTRTYAACCADTSKDFPAYPQYLSLPRPDASRVARFRVGSTFLHSVTGTWTSPPTPRDQRICNRCHLTEVDDEHHAIFMCPSSLDLRQKYPHLVTPNITSVRSFLSQDQPADVPKFISDLMKLIDSQWLQCQADTPV